MAIKGRRSTPEERLRAVQLLKEGNEAELVARMFGVSRAIVFRWQQKYDADGPAALETKKTPGPAPRLSPTQMSQLYAIVTGCDPRQLQFDFGLWTRKIIRDLILQEFGIKFSEVQVGRLLKKMGLSAQRPLYRAYQRDPERVEKWKEVIYPRIRELAADEGASIFFEDETGLRTDHHAGTMRDPVGQTPVVIKTGERKSISMVSAISPRGELSFRVQDGSMNADRFIDFLKALLGGVKGKIFLIVDDHPAHKAKKVKEFIENEPGGRLKIFFLPSYSPDLNLDEWVWNNVKNDRADRKVIMSKDDLKAKSIGALRRLQKLPGVVRGFFRDPHLSYIWEGTTTSRPTARRLSMCCHDGDELAVRQVLDIYRDASVPLVIRTRDEIAALFTGLDLVEPGLVRLSDWRPEPLTRWPGVVDVGTASSRQAVGELERFSSGKASALAPGCLAGSHARRHRLGTADPPGTGTLTGIPASPARWDGPGA
jgi:transposase